METWKPCLHDDCLDLVNEEGDEDIYHLRQPLRLDLPGRSTSFLGGSMRLGHAKFSPETVILRICQDMHSLVLGSMQAATLAT